PGFAMRYVGGRQLNFARRAGTALCATLLFAALAACSKSPDSAPAGNADSYGGTDRAQISLHLAPPDLIDAVPHLQNGFDTDSLCQSICTPVEDGRVCGLLAAGNATDGQRDDARKQILKTLPDALAVLQRDPTQLFDVSDTTLTLNGYTVTAKTPYGP